MQYSAPPGLAHGLDARQATRRMLVETASQERKREPIPESSFRYVLRRIASGSDITAACMELRAKGTRGPSPARFLRWCQKRPDREQAYARARASGIELRITSMYRRIARCNATDPAMLSAQVARMRLVIDTSKWEACKVIPKLYGDKLQHEHSGNVSITVDTGIPALTQIPAMRQLDDDDSQMGSIAYELGRGIEVAAPVADAAASAVRLLDE